MFVELIYEDGSHSVACYEDEDEARGAIEAAQERAKSGQPAVAPAEGERAQVAVRVKRALMYEEHPGSYGETRSVSADEATAALKDIVKALKDENGVVSVPELALAVQDLEDPRKNKENPHDSMYKMEEKKELEVPE